MKQIANLILFILLLLPFGMYAQVTGFTLSPSSPVFYKTNGIGATSDIIVSISVDAIPLALGNTFRVEISDADGTFPAIPNYVEVAPIAGGTMANSTTNVLVNIPNGIPSTTATDAGYRFRVRWDEGTGFYVYESSMILPADPAPYFQLQELPSISITAAGLLPGGVTGTKFCEGSQIIFGTDPGSFTKTGNFGGSNTFFLDISDASGNFSSDWFQGSQFGIGSIVSSNPNIIYGTIPVVDAAPLGSYNNGEVKAPYVFGSGHKFRIRSTNPVAYSNELSPYTVTTILAPPASVPNQWTAYVYADRIAPYIQFDKYRGYFNAGTSNSFNSSTFYSATNSPSKTLGYVGCEVEADYHSVNYKRTGFTCGFYQFNVNVDDECKLLIDGIQVYTRTTAGSATNVWRCFLGSTSTVEYKVSEKTGNSTANLTLTALAIDAALQPFSNPTICTGNSATLTAAPVTGANINTGTLTYQWTGGVAGDYTGATNLASVTLNPTVTTTFTVTATNTATGCTNSRTVTVNVATTLTVSINPTTASICPGGGGATITASGATNYTWSPATGLNITSGAVVIANPASTTTYTVTGTSGGCSDTETITVNVGATAITPTFGNGVWNVYAYSNSGNTTADGFAVILGSYTENNLSYNTQTRWSQNASPSSANATGGTAYTGCTVPNDYHSYKYMRTNFPCGIYQIVVNNNDNNITLFVDGVQKYTRATSATAANMWRGFLGPTSTLEVRSVETTGNSSARLSVTLVDPITMANPIVCENISTTLSANTTPDGPDAQINTTYTWTQTGGPTNTLTGTGSSVTFPATTVVGTYTYQCDISNNLVGNPDGSCTVTDVVTVTVTNTIPVTAITPNPTTICGGGSVTLTASGGNLYQWYYMDSTTIKNGVNTIVGNPGVDGVHWKLAGVAASRLTPVTGVLANLSSLLNTNGAVVATPLVSTRYAAIVSVGGTCPTGFAYVDVIVGAASNPNNFIPNIWSAYCYNGNNFQQYYGYYTIGTQGFNANAPDRWGINNNPSSAPNLNPTGYADGGTGYKGCTLPSDNFSINLKRQSFACGFYQINFPNFNDDINLRIGAGDAFGTTTTALATVAGFPKLYTGTAANNVWRGFLGTASQLEMTLREYTGVAGVNIEIIDITTAVQSALITSAPVVVCQGASTVLTASLTGNAVPASTYTYTWTSNQPGYISFSPASGVGTSILANVALGTPDGTLVDITCTVVDNITGCSISQIKYAHISVSTTFTTLLTSDKATICPGDLGTFTVIGANIYDWALTAGTGGTFTFPNATGTISKTNPFPAGTYASTALSLGNSYGNVVLFAPGASSTYTIQATGSTGGTCTSVNATSIITINNVVITDPGYGNGNWNVVCYNGTSPVISAYQSNGTGSIGTNIRGFFTENELSFNTEARWDKSLAPSIPTVNTLDGSAYTGCPVDNDNHTIVYKRTGISCSIYRIDIGNFTNALDLIVNGALVFSSPTGLTQKFNAWNGSLSPTDEVEIRMYHTSGNSYFSVNFAVIPPPPSSVIWTGGGGNADWQNVNNWCAGLPEEVTDVYIPAGTAFNPVINSLQAATIPIECKSINIAPGASLTIDAGYNLNVYGNWVNDGIFTADPTSIVVFRGSNNATIGGISSTTFSNVEFDKAGAIVTLDVNTAVSKTMNLKNVQLHLNQQTLTISNSSPSAISRFNDSYILSETNTGYNPSILCWKMDGQSAGTMYTFPFGKSKTYYIPVYFTKNTGDAYTICASTRGTGIDNAPYAESQSASWSSTMTDASLVVDRWWDITSSLNPLPGAGAQITLSYGADSNTLPITTTSVQIFHFDPINGTWDAPYIPASINVPVTTGIGTAQASASVNKFSPHVIADPSAALPVSLVDFSAKSDGKQVLLEWQTATEIDNDYFTIERSTDAKTFETIAKLKSKQSNSDVLTYYEMLDDKPIYGISYYRLKQTDINGANSYSKILSVELDIALELILTPNPTTADKVGILVTGGINSQVKFSMKDLEGRQVYAQLIEIKETGKAEIIISESKSLAVGVYICTIQVGSKIISRKLVIQ